MWEAGSGPALASQAELADSANPARAARAARGVVCLEDPLTHIASCSRRASNLLQGPGAHVSTALLHQLASRATTAVLSAVDPAGAEPKPVPKPYCGDWRGCVEPWRASAAAFHTPCRGDQLAEVESVEEARAAGRLNTLSPKGLFAIHLLECPQCVDAELAGSVNVQCEVHTLVALMRGAWVVPGEGKQPKGVGGASSSKAKQLPPVDVTFLRQQLLELRSLGVIEYEAPSSQHADGPQLEGGPPADPPPARLHVVWKNRMLIPPDVAAVATAPGGALDIQRLAKSAAAMAEADGAAIASAQLAASSAAERAAVFEEVTGRRYDQASRKGRVVVGLDRTVNPKSKRLSVEFTTAAEAMAACGPSAVGRVYDGEKAYLQVPLHPSAQPAFRILDERGLGRPDEEGGPLGTPLVARYVRCPFGGGQTCTLFSAPTALMRAALRVGHSARGGEAFNRATAALSALGPRFAALAACLRERVAARNARGGEVGPFAVEGILDDIADCFSHVSTEESALADRFAQLVFDASNFRLNGKTQIGDNGVIEVLGARADLRAGTLTPKGRKLFESLYQLALLRALADKARDGGGGVVSVPTPWLESAAGSFEWSGPTFEWRLRLHRQGLYAAVRLLTERHYAEARMSPGSVVAAMLSKDVRFALDRALSGRWRPMQFYPAGDLSVIRVTCARALSAELPRGEARVQGLVEEAVMPSTGRQVVGIVGDASIDAGEFGRTAWAIHVPVLPAAGSGGSGGGPAGGAVGGAGEAATRAQPSHEVLFRSVVKREADSSGTLELEPWVEALERHGTSYSGRFLVAIGDNLGNVYRVNRGRVKRGTTAHQLLTRFYELLDWHDIDFVALWLPRAANQLLDALSKCRTLRDAQERAQAAGVRLVGV